MSILIRDMEMPESCYRCPMANDDFYLCGATEKYLENDSEERRPDWCPLTEVKEPHGDLVDRDKLMVDVMDSDLDHLQRDDWKEVIQIVSDADVVIEAKGERNEQRK